MTLRRTLGALLRAGAFLVAASSSLSARDYYIDAANGNNATNDGSINSPLQTYAALSGPWKRFTLAAGDNVYFRGNAVHQQSQTGAFGFDQVASAASPITVRSYPGEWAIIDGSQTQWTQNTFEITGSASHIILRDLEIRNSNMGAIGVLGGPTNLQFRNLVIHGSQWQAVHLTPASTVNGVIIDNITAFNNARQNSNPDGTPRKHDAGWPSIFSLSGSNVTMTNCHVYENYGEGVGFYGTNQRIANCRVHDNFSVNIYVNNVANSVCEQNLVYTTYKRNHYRAFNPTNLAAAAPAVGIEMASEGPYGYNNDNNRVSNNIVFGGHSAFFYWAANNLPLNHATIANNTFVGGLGTGNVVHMDGNSHTASLFANNIVSQGPAAGLSNIGGTSGMTWSKTLWHGTATPDADGVGASDLYGDPRLVSPGGFSAEDYYLADSASAAVNSGVAVASVPVDYFGSARPQGGATDIGADEWDGVTRPQRTAQPTVNPADGSYASPLSITLGSATAGATIRYTTDGSTPTATTGTVYSGPFNLVSASSVTPFTVKALAVKAGLADSYVTTGLYNVGPGCAAPTFSPAPGTYTSVQSVALATTTSGATIRYTLNGAAPTATTGTVYSGPISIGAGTTTVRAVAVKSGFFDSPLALGVYTVNIPGYDVTYTLTGNSTTKWKATVKIKNLTGAAVANWTMTFAFNAAEQVTSWPSTVSGSQSGKNVTISNAPGKLPMANGQEISFTISGTQTALQTAPATFTVNGLVAY